MTAQITHVGAPGLTIRAYPLSKGTFVDWAEAVALTDPNNVGLYQGDVDIETFGNTWYIFESATTPTTWDEAVATWSPVTANEIRSRLLEAGAAEQIRISYPQPVTNPSVNILRDGAIVGTATSMGTGTQFVFNITIPANSDLGQNIQILTQESPAREMLFGQIVEAVESLATETYEAY